MSRNPVSPTVPQSTEEDMNLADNPVFVLLVYALVLVPLALYVFHDILDKRWRPIHRVIRFNFAYLLLYAVATTGLVAYIVVQLDGADYKEVGAAFLALIVGTHRLWSLIRLRSIIKAHRRLVMILKTCNERLSRLSMKTEWFQEINYAAYRKPDESTYGRHMYISASLFDDSYPGDSVRIRWISTRAKVHENDINECASRIAIWMRVVLGNTRRSIWDVLTGSTLRDYEKGYYGKLYETLLTQFSSKTVGRAPHDVSMNPGEDLINLGETITHGSLRGIGAGTFWIAGRMRNEELGNIVSEMPTRWMHPTGQSGKELMFELGCILMLADMEIPEGPVGRLIQLTGKDIHKENSENIWKLTAEVSAEATAKLILRDQDEDQIREEDTSHKDKEIEREVPRKRNVVKNGLVALRRKHSGGTIRMLAFSMACNIRRAYLGGYIVESVWGEYVNHAYVHEGCPIRHLYVAEIVLSLYHALATLGHCKRGLFNEDAFEEEKKSMLSKSCDRNEGPDCPSITLRIFMRMAGRAARMVYKTFLDIQNNLPRIKTF